MTNKRNKHLIMVLQAPLAVYPAARVDRYGTTHHFPTLSMLTGLLANALGYDRSEHEMHQRLQRRMIFACREDRPGPGLLREFQTARMHSKERAWTTTGVPEERTGGDYQLYDMRQEYHQDTSMTVALRLEFPGESPTLEELAEALEQPERPLFIGKKHCLPTERIMAGFQEGDTALDAIRETPLRFPEEVPDLVPVSWPPGEGIDGLEPARDTRQADIRNWRTGVHAGDRQVLAGTMPREWVRPPTGDGPDGQQREGGDRE